MTAGPGGDDARCVIICETVHDVMTLEKAFKAQSLWCDTIPTPRQLSSNCGMALEFKGRDLDVVMQLLDTSGLHWNGVYRAGGDVYEEL